MPPKFECWSRDENDHVQRETVRTDKNAAYFDKALVQDILDRRAWVVELIPQ